MGGRVGESVCTYACMYECRHPSITVSCKEIVVGATPLWLDLMGDGVMLVEGGMDGDTVRGGDE